MKCLSRASLTFFQFVCCEKREERDALIFEKKKKGTDTPSRRTRIMDAIISVAGAHGLDEECGW